VRAERRTIVKLSSLLATVLTTSLTLGAPAVALAGSNNNHADTNGTASDTAAYSHIGQGGMNGTAMPIANNNGNANDNDMTRPSQRNPLLADNGDIRLDKMAGTTVYNDQDQKLGSIDGIVAGKNGVWAIVSTDDQNKTVAVPIKDFVFGNYQANGDDELVLPHQTTAQLNKQPAFHYDASAYANNNGNNNG
jgi:hypothetical protein